MPPVTLPSTRAEDRKARRPFCLSWGAERDDPERDVPSSAFREGSDIAGAPKG